VDTLAPTLVYRHTRVQITTELRTELVDVTAGLEDLVADAHLTTGIVNVQSLHTTAAIVVNEGEPLLLDDFRDFLERLAPAEESYRHDDEARLATLPPDERPNGFAHCRALLLPPAVCLNIVNGRLDLGRWQRIFLAELDGPRQRTLSVVMMGEGLP
jgi:secondary thiamine-phosphate synthase enzyme